MSYITVKAEWLEEIVNRAMEHKSHEVELIDQEDKQRHTSRHQREENGFKRIRLLDEIHTLKQLGDFCLAVYEGRSGPMEVHLSLDHFHLIREEVSKNH